MPEKYTMISGRIKKLLFNNEEKSLLIVDKNGFEYVFHIYKFTIIMTFETLKVNQKVDIIFNGILTRSMPPQGTAIIVNGLKI